MKSLIGVECVECRRKGHHCQAQMWDGQTPVCLRCADGEPCYRVTAEGLPSPERYEDRAVEASFVLEERPTPPRPRKVKYVLPPIGTYERKMIRKELETASVERVAGSHGLQPWMIESVVGAAKKTPKRMPLYVFGRRCALRDTDAVDKSGPKPRVPKEIKPVRKRAYRPEKKIIGGECVVMAPMAVMGAEMCLPPRINLPLRTVQDAVTEYFGITGEDTISSSRGRAVVMARQIAMLLAKEYCHLSHADIARASGKHHTTVWYSVVRAEENCRGNADFKKSVETIKAKLDAELTH